MKWYGTLYMGTCHSINKQYSKLQHATEAQHRTFQGLTRLAKITHIYDGDTATIITNLTDEEPYYEYSLQLDGIDAPEIKPSLGVSYRKLHIDAAHRVRDILREQLLDQHGGIVYVDFVKEEKYGRLLGTVWTVKRKKLFHVPYGAWRKDANVNLWLINNKLVLPYNGGTKSEFREQFLDDIVQSPKHYEIS